VLSAAARAYWESTNNVHFPSSFDPSLAWNQQLGRKVLAFAEATTTNIYFMPIRVDLFSYFSGIFADPTA
jgi:methylenetetrahydrofolate reductase (NADPH)